MGDKLSSAPKQVELATAWINLEEMLHQAKRDTRNEELTLRVADGARKDSVMARVRIDLERCVARWLGAGGGTEGSTARSTPRIVLGTRR